MLEPTSPFLSPLALLPPTQLDILFMKLNTQLHLSLFILSKYRKIYELLVEITWNEETEIICI